MGGILLKQVDGSQSPGGPGGPRGPDAPGTPGTPASPRSPFWPSLPTPGVPGAPEVTGRDASVHLKWDISKVGHIHSRQNERTSGTRISPPGNKKKKNQACSFPKEIYQQKKSC